MEASTRLLLEYDLQFFAKEAETGGEKTEPASQKKLDDARKKGQVAKSKELVSGVELIGLFLTMKIYIGMLGTRFMDFFNFIYANKLPDFVEASRGGASVKETSSLLGYVILQLMITALPFWLVGFMIAVVTNIAQVKWVVSAEPMKPKFSKLNPINGFKRIFSKESIFNLLMSIIKVALIFYIAYMSIKDHANELFILYDIPLNQAISLLGDIIINTGLRISIVYLIVGVVDFIYQKHKFNEDMKMTKQEVKDEYKMTEGDPKIKGQQRQRMQEASRRRMMSNVPQADVVITNPTHLAVAIKYDAERARAPIVVAKGADFVAQKIKDMARDADIPVVENKPLARALYATVEVDQEIPPELYEAVAEILAIVYRDKGLA